MRATDVVRSPPGVPVLGVRVAVMAPVLRPLAGRRGRRRRSPPRHRTRQRRHRAGSRVIGARTLARPPRSSPRATGPLMYRHAFTADATEPRAHAGGSPSTASSTRPTCGSTAPTSATRRATSSPTVSTSRRCPVSATSTSWPSRSTCAPQPIDRPGAATSPVCSSPGTASVRTGTRAACGVPVLLYDTGPVRVDRLRVLCRDADARRAHLRISPPARQRRPRRSRAHLRRRRAGRRAAPVDRRRPQRDRVDDRHRRPALWWPRALGEQPLIEVAVEVVVDGEAERPAPAPHRTPPGRVGRLDLFGQRRAPLPQGRQHAAHRAPGRPTPTDGMVRRRSARRGRPRPRCAAPPRPHRRPRVLYHAADEARHPDPAGLPAAVGPRPSRSPAGRRPGPCRRRHAGTPPVDRACGPLTTTRRPPTRASLHRGGEAPHAPIAAKQLPSWNKSVLDRWVKRAFETADSSRQIVAHSGVVPHSPAARRHRQPPLVRVAQRRGRGSRRLRRPTPPHGAIRQRVRMPTHHRTTAPFIDEQLRSNAAGRPRLGPHRRGHRLSARRVRAQLPADRVRQLRGVARRRRSTTRPTC